jgi:hypothetical protein
LPWGLGLYLLGLFAGKRTVITGLQNADRVRRIRRRPAPARVALGVGVLFLSFYLTFTAVRRPPQPSQLLSGLAPPLSYSIYGGAAPDSSGALVVNDYERALRMAKRQNKPLLIDFTGWACVNCRRMEEQVWTDPEVERLIKENYILVSLYVDDRKQLPAGEQVPYRPASGGEKWMRTEGEKWAAFQAERFHQVTQPLYVLLSPDETVLNHPVGYTPDARAYSRWLGCGIEAFQQKFSHVLP